EHKKDASIFSLASGEKHPRNIFFACGEKRCAAGSACCAKQQFRPKRCASATATSCPERYYVYPSMVQQYPPSSQQQHSLPEKVLRLFSGSTMGKLPWVVSGEGKRKGKGYSVYCGYSMVLVVSTP
ncbi:unnamed protein product, partial [Laminaria digitata]